jgi:hypothetical protein
MEDSLRVNEPRFRDAYVTGFKIWTRLYTAAIKSRNLISFLRQQ